MFWKKIKFLTEINIKQKLKFGATTFAKNNRF